MFTESSPGDPTAEPEESLEARAAQEAEEAEARRIQDALYNNLVERDLLTELGTLADYPDLQLKRDVLLFLYSFPGGPFDAFFPTENEENRTIREQYRSIIAKQRSPELRIKDLAIMLECKEEQIARAPEEITPETKAYVGRVLVKDARFKVFPLFTALPEAALEHLYTSFPEGRVQVEKFEDVLKSGDQHALGLEAAGIEIDEYTQTILDALPFPVGNAKEVALLVRLRLRDFGFTKNPAWFQIDRRRAELGLEECSPGIGLAYVKKYGAHLMGQDMYIGTPPLPGHDNYSNLFEVYHRFEQAVLLGASTDEANSSERFDVDHHIVFRIQK